MKLNPMLPSDNADDLEEKEDENGGYATKALDSWTSDDIQLWFNNYKGEDKSKIANFFNKVVSFGFSGYSLMGVDKGMLSGTFKISKLGPQKNIIKFINNLKKQYTGSRNNNTVASTFAFYVL